MFLDGSFKIQSSIGAAWFLMSLPTEHGFVLGLKLQRFRAYSAAAETRLRVNRKSNIVNYKRRPIFSRFAFR